MGAKTFDLVSSYNFRVKLLESPSAEEFSQKIFDELEGNEEIYLPGANERAFPMDSFFREKGFSIKRIDCYHTVKKVTNTRGELVSERQKKKIANDPAKIIFFASPSAVKSFLESFVQFEKLLKANIRAIVLGASTERSCKSFFKKVYRTKKPLCSEAITLYQVISLG